MIDRPISPLHGRRSLPCWAMDLVRQGYLPASHPLAPAWIAVRAEPYAMVRPPVAALVQGAPRSRHQGDDRPVILVVQALRQEQGGPPRAGS